MDRDFYHVLGIEQTASKKEVREAYVRKIREYPPELHPDEFKAIREAYEVLSNENARQEYDTMLMHGEEINQLLEQGLNKMDLEQHEEAASIFKKILVINSSLNYVRNYYALSLSYQDDKEKKEKAVLQFRKLIEYEPNNATYHMNLGMLLNEMGKPEEAIKIIKNGYLNDSDNIDLLFGLVDVYLRLKDYSQAKHLLNTAIHKLAVSDFRSFLLFFKLLEIDILSSDTPNIHKTFSSIEMLIIHNEDQRSYVVDRLVKLVFKLADYKNYSNAKLLCNKALILDPHNENLHKLLSDVTVQSKLYDEYNLLKEDSIIISEVGRIFTVYLFGDEVSEEEFEKYHDEAYDDLFKASKYAYSETIVTIKRIKDNYPLLYERRKEALEEALKVAMRYHQIEIQYEKMKNDTLIISGIKRLIALYLSDNLSEDERSEYFDDIGNEIDSYSYSQINQSCTRLKQIYPNLYQLNSQFIDEIINNTTESRPSSTGSPNAYNQSSSSSSCFVATVAYGTPLTEELDILRLWRDKVLKKSKIGLVFVRYYYRYGAYLASIVEKSDCLKAVVRKFIYHLIPVLDRKYDLNKGLNYFDK